VIDIIYPTFNRLEFTKESLSVMIRNTDWAQVRKLILYDDGSSDGTREYLKSVEYPAKIEFVFEEIGGPVAITNRYLSDSPSDIFCKIDNDTMLPANWLSESLKVMNAHPELGLLGIDTFNPVRMGTCSRGYRPALFIGGVGLMRRSCFKTLPRPNGRFGFTQWQRESKSIKGWINPSIPVFMLDKIYLEPWASLSKEYVARGWQRSWPLYKETESILWSWAQEISK
jgi:glycosyltransferase involved in cell wall biosynthesis